MENELTVVKVARLKHLESSYDKLMDVMSAEWAVNRRLGLITLASGLNIRICVGEHIGVESKNETPECTPRYPRNGFDWLDLVVEGREPQVLKDWRVCGSYPLSLEDVDLWEGQQFLYEGLPAYMLQNVIASEGGIIEGSVRSDINMPKMLKAPNWDEWKEEIQWEKEVLVYGKLFQHNGQVTRLGNLG